MGLKCVEMLKGGIHAAQSLTHMRLADVRQGLLISFNVRRLQDGLKRFAL